MAGQAPGELRDALVAALEEQEAAERYDLRQRAVRRGSADPSAFTRPLGVGEGILAIPRRGLGLIGRVARQLISR